METEVLTLSPVAVSYISNFEGTHDRSIICKLMCQKQYLGNLRARIINEICKITYQQLKIILTAWRKSSQARLCEIWL